MFAVSLEAVVSGLATGWASPYLAQLTLAEADDPLKLTATEASWVASLLNLGRLVGALLGAFCQGKSSSLYDFLLKARFIDHKFKATYRNKSLARSKSSFECFLLYFHVFQVFLIYNS